MIEIENATKLYGNVIGVNDITLQIPSGAYGLLGPNGSGKTTLLNLLTGQLRPTLGRVRIFDQNPWRNNQLLKLLGLCPAGEIYLPNVSALDWVTYLVELHGFSQTEASQRAEETLRRVGMQDAMRRKIGNYSLGMRQRTKLAQSIAHDPQLLILDEPFNGLDPIARYEMTRLLLDWIEAGKSLIIASHILHEVEAITPDFLLIRGGRLLASGSSQEIHRMLAETPNELTIRSSDPRRVATRLLELPTVKSVRFADNEGTLTCSVDNARVVCDILPQWTQDTGVEVYEIRSPEDSLQSLFNALMRMHRGELK